MEIAACLWPHAQGYLQIAMFCLHIILFDRPSFANNYGIDTCGLKVAVIPAGSPEIENATDERNQSCHDFGN